MREFYQKQVAGLDCIVWEKPGNQKAIVLLHGYGADFRDLSALAPELDPQQNFDWYFPNGILSVPIGPHTEGRAWFPIDMIALQEAMLTGNRRPFANRIPDGLEHASQRMQKLLEELHPRYTKLIVGGFSQGAMLSCDVALHMQEAPAALLQLSSSLVAQARWEPLFAQRSGLKVFQSHGQSDPILPFQSAEELAKFFQIHNYALNFVHFSGAHEIPRIVLQKLQKFLQEI